MVGRQHEAIRQALGRRDAALRRADSVTERRSAIERRLAMLRNGISVCLRRLGAAAAAQAWEAGAPSLTGGGGGGGGGGGTILASRESGAAESGAGAGAGAMVGGRPPSGSGLQVAGAPPPHPSVAACAHVMAGLALLEQRASAIIAVQVGGQEEGGRRRGVGGGGQEEGGRRRGAHGTRGSVGS